MEPRTLKTRNGTKIAAPEVPTPDMVALDVPYTAAITELASLEAELAAIPARRKTAQEAFIVSGNMTDLDAVKIDSARLPYRIAAVRLQIADLWYRMAQVEKIHYGELLREYTPELEATRREAEEAYDLAVLPIDDQVYMARVCYERAQYRVKTAEAARSTAVEAVTRAMTGK